MFSYSFFLTSLLWGYITSEDNKFPVSDINANLHPLANPGSIPNMGQPFVGANSSNCFRFLLKTSHDAFSALSLSSARTSLIIKG